MLTCCHWTIASGVCLRYLMTISQKVYWVIPNSVKKVPVKEINFYGKQQTHSSWSNNFFVGSQFYGFCFSINWPSSMFTKFIKSFPISYVNSLSIRIAFRWRNIRVFSALASTCTSTKPAILSIIEPFSFNYVPKSLDEDLPMCLPDLMTPANITKDYGEPLTISKQLASTVTHTQVEAVESKTRGQSQSQLWYSMRSGRITTSYFKSACPTNEATPSTSLKTTICLSGLVKFTKVQNFLGMDNEKTACDLHWLLSTTVHEDFKILNLFSIIMLHFLLLICADGRLQQSLYFWVLRWISEFFKLWRELMWS